MTPLEALPTGPELAGLLTTDPAGLSGYDLVSYLGATERLTAWVQSRQLAAIRELARRRPAPLDPGDAGELLPAGGVSEFAANEVAAELRISTGGAQARLQLALALDRLPGTRQALEAGRLDLTKTRAVVEATAVLDDPACLAVEARVLGRAPDQTVGRLRAALARAVIAVDAGARAGPPRAGRDGPAGRVVGAARRDGRPLRRPARRRRAGLPHLAHRARGEGQGAR